MPVHQINVNPPDRQPPLSLGPSNNNSPAGGEGLPEWTPRVTSHIYLSFFIHTSFIKHLFPILILFTLRQLLCEY